MAARQVPDPLIEDLRVLLVVHVTAANVNVTQLDPLVARLPFVRGGRLAPSPCDAGVKLCRLERP